MIFRFLTGFSLLLFVASSASAANWEIRTLGGRDYIPVSQIARFYTMRTVSRGTKGVSLVSDTRRIDLNQGSREARIDGVKHWLSFPVLGFGGRLYVSRMAGSMVLERSMRET